MKYSFTLKDNNQKAYKLFTWFLFFLHIAAAMFVLNTTDNKVRISMYILLGFYAVLSTLYYFYRKHSKALETFSLVMALMYCLIQKIIDMVTLCLKKDTSLDGIKKPDKVIL